jgi:Zn-dependent oligopeptidase
MLYFGVFLFPLAAHNNSIQPPIWAGNLRIEDFRRLENEKLAAADSTIASLTKSKGVRTIENTLQPYDEADLQLNDAWGIAVLARETNPD